MLRITSRPAVSSIRCFAGTRSIASSTSTQSPLFTSSSGASSSKDEPFRMLMLAKPGSGKGTLSGRLMEKYDIKFLSTGDILRQHIKDQTEVGRAAEAIVASGGLMPDELMLKLISSKLASMRGKNWILDGFPRTLAQGQRLDSYLAEKSSPLSLVVHLDVPDEVIMARITDRWIHPGSGRIYNYSYNKPKVLGVDDVTGEPLVRRPDDDPKVYARRLKSFYNSTAPLLEYYNSQTPVKLVSLSGTTSDEIWPKLDSVIQSRFRLKQKPQAMSSVSDAVIRQPASERARPDAKIDVSFA
ncbi:hypothetical protein FRB93_012044 [Tulasnella sp. JGI-2019a]|nr:hypothetical protein FRB93_012044 [Tulasnella sp. JGI-2019a]